MNLNNLAETSGLNEACEKLKGSDLNPDEVAAICAELRAELEQVKNEVARQVSGQVHDAGFASSMLSKAVNEMDGVSAGLSKISERCDQVRENTPGFDYLRRATIAKRNLHSVIEQLDLYGRVPNRVRRLLSELDREPRGDNLRRIFREWLGLSAWRDRVIGHVEDEATKAAQAEERAWRRARGEVLENDDPKLAEEDSRTPSSASFETMLALLKDHFKDSYVLGDRLFEIVIESAFHTFELCRDRPQDLVLFAEMCERRDRQVARELKRRGLLRGPNQFDSKRVEYVTRLGEFADERAARVLKQDPDIVRKKAPHERMQFDELLAAADNLLTDIQIIARDARPCFPRNYDILGVFRKWYEARLVREFSERIHDSVTEEELPSQEMLMMASWIANYCASVKSLYEGEAVLGEEQGYFPRDVVGLERLCDNLLERYLTERALPRIAHECREKIKLLATSVVRIAPSEDVTSEHGYLKTELPNAIFAILSEEMHLCNKHFNGERTLKVFSTLVDFVATWYLPDCEKKLKEAEIQVPEQLVERVCAWLTDSNMCQTLIRELFDTSAEGLMRVDDVALIISKASDIVENSCTLFRDSAMKFAREELVEKRIMADISSQVIPNMFSKEWEESRYLGARVITATFEDWFFHQTQGLREWVANDFVLGRAFLLCLENFVKVYVNGLLVWKNKFGSAKRAAGRVEEDAKAIAMFFKRHLVVLKLANSASCRTEDDVEKKFKVMHLLADVLQGDEFNLDPLVEIVGNIHGTKVVIKRLRALRGGRVFNRREADLDKELGTDEAVAPPVANTARTGKQPESIFDIPTIEALGVQVGEFEGELTATSFIETPQTASTERQVAFVKKISAFARSASFSGGRAPGLSGSFSGGRAPAFSTNTASSSAAGVGGGGGANSKTQKNGKDEQATNVLTMNEFIAPSRRS